MTNTRTLTTTALMAALLCVLGPLTVPLGPIPFSLATLAIYLTMYILDTKRGTLAVGLYLLIGLLGIPVFSGFTGGPAKLLGPTGGFLLAYLPMALLLGLYLSRHWRQRLLSILMMELISWLLYGMGTLWLAYSAGMDLKAAFAAAVLPFLLPDLLKIVLAASLGPELRRRLAPFSGTRIE